MKTGWNRWMKLGLALLPLGLAVASRAGGATEETQSAVFLASAFFAYLFVPTLVIDRRAR